MWEYYLDESSISQAVSTREYLKKSNYATKRLLISLGYNNEYIKNSKFDDLIFTSGSMDETYSTEEIKFCESIGDIFVSIEKDIFDFFILDIDEEHRYDEFYIGSIIKIINKAFKGRNIIIFQCNDSIMFGSRYISKFVGRDFHFTYWMNDVSKIGMFASYNVCSNNPNYSYALFMSKVNQMSVFKNKYWNDRTKDEENVPFESSFIALSKALSYIVSRQIDSFDLLDKALQVTNYISTDKKMSEYRAAFYDDENEQEYDEELLLNYLKL